MTKQKGISIAELNEYQAKEKKSRFSAEDERRHALLLLAQMADLTQRERARVLRRAHTINDI